MEQSDIGNFIAIAKDLKVEGFTSKLGIIETFSPNEEHDPNMFKIKLPEDVKEGRGKLLKDPKKHLEPDVIRGSVRLSSRF